LATVRDSVADIWTHFKSGGAKNRVSRRRRVQHPGARVFSKREKKIVEDKPRFFHWGRRRLQLYPGRDFGRVRRGWAAVHKRVTRNWQKRVE